MTVSTPSPFTTPPHILYIEDDATNTLLVQRIAEGFNFNLTVADNATEGMQKAVESKPDIILMDVNLPDMDGLAATQMLLSLPEMKDARIIAVTASAMFGDRERCLEAGCVGYISKPFQIKTLLSEIKHHLPASFSESATDAPSGSDSPTAPTTPTASTVHPVNTAAPSASGNGAAKSASVEVASAPASIPVTAPSPA